MKTTYLLLAFLVTLPMTSFAMPPRMYAKPMWSRPVSECDDTRAVMDASHLARRYYAPAGFTSIVLFPIMDPEWINRHVMECAFVAMGRESSGAAGRAIGIWSQEIVGGRVIGNGWKGVDDANFCNLVVEQSTGNIYPVGAKGVDESEMVNLCANHK